MLREYRADAALAHEQRRRPHGEQRSVAAVATLRSASSVNGGS